MALTLEDIDKVLSTKKYTAGHATWSSGQRETIARLKIPLMIDGEIYPQLFLQGDATVHCEVQRGGLSLVLNQKSIERMDIYPQKAHSIKLDKNIPKQFRGLILDADVHRYYHWRDNRRWPREAKDNLNFGKFIDRKIDTYRDAINYFLCMVHVEGDVPQPPFDPRLL